MPDYIITLIIFVVAFWLGWKIRTAIVMYHLGQDPDRMIGILNKIKEINAKNANKNSTVKDELASDVKIEHHHGHVYLFEHATDKFLAQGATVTDAVKEMDKRFPGQFELKVVIPDSHSA